MDAGLQTAITRLRRRVNHHERQNAPRSTAVSSKNSAHDRRDRAGSDGNGMNRAVFKRRKGCLAETGLKWGCSVAQYLKRVFGL